MAIYPLTPQQIRFCEEYLVDLNGTAAALRAGYSEKSARSQASRHLADDRISAFVLSLMEARSTRTEVTADRVVDELRKIAFSDMRNVATWNESGVSFKPCDAIGDDAAAAIQEVAETVNEQGGTLKIRQYDKLKALELLGKHLGIYLDKTQLSGDPNKPVMIGQMTPEQLDIVRRDWGFKK